MATNISPPLQASASAAAPIANAWHTWGLLVTMLVLSFTGSGRLAASAARPHGRVIMYVGSIIMDWVIVGYIWMGVKRRGHGLRDLIGGRWNKVDDFLVDLFTAVCFWVSWSILVVAVTLALRQANLDPAKTMNRVQELKKTIGFLVPQGWLETILFIGLTLSAGFCEEVTYRGYFQRQFTVWTRSVSVAVVAQGVFFGASHGYQGVKAMSVIGLLGCALGMLAAWRKNLRPGMMAHAWQDLFTGMVLKIVMKLTP